MTPASTSGSANSPTAHRFAAPVNCASVAEVTVVFWLDVVVGVTTGISELEFEVVVVGKKGEVTTGGLVDVATLTGSEERLETP